jgi:K+-sensing histidine kinase KdpD
MPKQLSDEQILDVIASMRKGQRRVTGSAVRAELRRAFGTPGGVDRIYKLINTTQTEPASSGDGEALRHELASLTQQLALAIQRAELAEHREQAHQEKWAMEIDHLRQQLLAAQVDSRRLSDAQNQVLELRRELHRLTAGSGSQD